MAKIFIDRVVRVDTYDIESTEDIFSRILEERKQEIDKDRFFLSYVSVEDLGKYDFRSDESVEQFRSDCVSIDAPLRPMGGCNLRQEEIKKGIRYSALVK